MAKKVTKATRGVYGKTTLAIRDPDLVARIRAAFERRSLGALPTATMAKLMAGEWLAEQPKR